MDDPWTCCICNGEMLKTSKHFLTCENNHGPLYSAPRVRDLPIAVKVPRRGPFTRLFWIRKEFFYWRYVPHAHKKALDQRPKTGTIVARVFIKEKWYARVFQPSSCHLR